ncbi:MAG: ABC transporter ATP-binding protein [Gemmatimonadota bacterium]
MTVLSVAGLTKVFGSGDAAVVALNDVSFDVHAGELVALLGPSGSGKTTLLLCTALILDPTSGSIAMNGKELYSNGWRGIDRRRIRRESIGFIFQSHNLIPFLSVLDNVALPLQLAGTSGRRARARAHELLEYLEIGHRSNHLPANLSGGEQQRVAIGRALANRPPLILADEPTASLDTGRGMKVMALLKRVAREQNAAVIAVTHDTRMIAGFDTTFHMDDGRLTQLGSSSEAVASASGPIHA